MRGRGHSGDRRGALRRGCFAAAAACLVLFVAVPALAQDERPAGPEVWRGSANAEGVTFEVDRTALLPIGDALRFSAVEASGAYETDRQTARGSILYPGEGVLQGPNLVCGTFGSAFPPEAGPLLDLCATYDYPLSVVADATTPEKSSVGSLHLGKATDPISVDAVAARAKADPDGSLGEAVIQDLRVLGLPTFDLIPLIPIEDLALDPTIARVGAATSRTEQRIDDRGRLVVTATSTLTGVRLVGGLVRIGAIRSTSEVTDDGNGTRTAEAGLEVSGVTVAGLPAQITEDGLVLGSPTGTGPILQQLSQAVNQLLGSLGVKLALVAGEETPDDGKGGAVASAGALLLEVSLNADGLPTVPGPLGEIDLNGTYVGSVQLGFTAASGGASTFGPDAGPPPDDGGTTPDFSGSDLGTDGGVAFAPVEPSLPRPTTGGGDPPVAPASSSGPDLFGGRLQLLYAAFALTVLGLCIAPGLAVPARLPGPPA